MPDTLSILLLEDDAAFADVFTTMMQKRQHKVVFCATLDAFTHALNTNHYDLILMDLKLKSTTSIDQIANARKLQPQAKIIMITAFASISTTVQAIKLGADDYLPKPFTINDVLNAYYGNNNYDRQSESEKSLTPKQLEWEYIQKVLAENNGNISQTAKALNMHRRTLQRKLNKKPI
ncbi:MAG: response regulator [Cellvibrionales bacterium]|nr:response regulator [Cellvibrionales bacterium]